MTRRDGSTLEISHFTVGDLHQLRTMVARAAHRVGLSRPCTENLVLAVNEVAVNAIQYAGGGSLVVEAFGDAVAVRVTDHGPGLPGHRVDIPEDRPPVDAVGGRGLWLARRLCQGLSIISGPAGVTVRLNMSRADG
jgi:anti-sigma regulatory factor (Ser/Thr protein kinase)